MATTRLQVIAGLHRQPCLATIGKAEIAGRYGGSEDDAWASIVAMDPTPTKRYLQWLCRRIEAAKLKPEDFYKAPALLLELNRARPLMRAAGISRDINQYDGLPALSTALQPFQASPTAGELTRAERDLVDAETVVHHRCDKLMIVEPKTERSSCYWGRGTQWCTAATEGNNAFSEYTEDGNSLFVYILADGTKFQSCSNGDFTDAQDNVLDWDEIPDNFVEAITSSHAAALNFAAHFTRALKVFPQSLGTPEMYAAAVQGNGAALQDVPQEHQTPELCAMAVRQNGRAIQRVPREHLTPELCAMAVRQSGRALHRVPAELVTADLLAIAVRQDGWALRYVPREHLTPELCALAVRQNGRALHRVPAELVTADLCALAVRQDGWAIESVPRELMTAELCESAVCQDPTCLPLVPEHLREQVNLALATVAQPESKLRNGLTL